MRFAISLIWLWLRFSVFGSWLGAFGWAGGISGLILYRWENSPLVHDLPAWLSALVVNQSPFKTALVGIGAALFVSLVFHAFFIAPLKAWWTVYPIELKIKNQVSVPEMIRDSEEKHQVWVCVKNRSPLRSLHYTLSVLQHPEKYADRHPWEVHTGDIPPKDEHNVVLANWFLGGATGNNRKIEIYSSRPGAFAEASILQLPSEGASLCLLIRTQNHPDKQAWCRLFVDWSKNRLILVDHV